MSKFGGYSPLNVTLDSDYIATIEMDNGELNYF